MKTYEERTQTVQNKLRVRRNRRRAAVVAVVMCLSILSAVLFVPFDTSLPDVSMYAGSDYYGIIQLLNEYNYNPPVYQNNFEKWSAGLSRNLSKGFPLAAPGDMANGNPGDAMPEMNADTGTEITDHQVAGVYEGDLIKRTETHIFYLKSDVLEIYNIAGEASQCVGTWKLNDDSIAMHYQREMYLSADGKTVTIILPRSGLFGDKTEYVRVISLNVTDPANVTLQKDFYITGAPLSSRMVDGKLLLMTQYTMSRNPNFDDVSTYVPMMGTPENMVPIGGDSIVLPDKMTSRRYTVVTMLEEASLEFVDAGAFLCYSPELYVSKDRIYATRAYTDNKEMGDGMILCTAMTEIASMGYGEDGLTNLGSFSLEGSVLNQYSMDEYEGVFRVVTETLTTQQKTFADGEYSYSTTMASQRNANLTCFEVGTWKQLAQVEAFAPAGETVESVRFDGDYAYVCTAVVVTLTDPVFFFDLSDLNNITYKDTGTIDGYSSSLVDIGDGYLLGIGVDDMWQLKVEIYEETADGVASVCAYAPGISGFANEYKAYYIDRENRLFGIPTEKGYVLLHFNGYDLFAVTELPVGGDLNEVRGVVIQKCLYVFSKEFAVKELL